MDQDNTQQILKESFERLPQDVKDAILKLDTRAIMGEMAKRHDLHIDQEGSLEMETMLVMFGLERPEDYVKNLKDALQIDQAKAEAIAVDANEKIFHNIRASLIKLHEEEDRLEREEEERLSREEMEKKEGALKEFHEPEENVSDLDKGDILKGIEHPIDAIKNPSSSVASPVLPKASTPPASNPAPKVISQIYNELPQIKSDSSLSSVLVRPTPPAAPSAVKPPLAATLPPKPMEETSTPVVVKKIMAPSYEQKLTGVVKTVAEEKKVSMPAPEMKKDYGGVDPYREPIN
jgi:hypothetical protein